MVCKDLQNMVYNQSSLDEIVLKCAPTSCGGPYPLPCQKHVHHRQVSLTLKVCRWAFSAFDEVLNHFRAASITGDHRSYDRCRLFVSGSAGDSTGESDVGMCMDGQS
jgi:hypothetical protein